MNVDIINLLDKVNSLCDEYEDKTNDVRTVPLKTLIEYNIYTFIDEIFKKNQLDRANTFNKIYYKESDRKISLYYQIDSLSIFGTEIFNESKLRELIIQLFTTIGKSFMNNAYDRSDFDIDCFTDYIKKLNMILYPIPNNVKNINKDELETKDKLSVEKSEDIDKTDSTEEEKLDEETIEELLDKLNSLIGLESVKKDVDGIISLIKVSKEREKRGIKSAPLSLHLVFSGNPGTGKTTIARLLAKIYKCLGVLSTGQFSEVDRSGLVGGYVGQTALKTQKVIDDALGGILFIDEAYSLTHGKGESDFGQEAVDTLLKAMEDHRDDFIVIVAGYPDLMDQFLASNPGLRSRFNKHIYFEDYKPEELYKIFELLCNDNQIIIAEECKVYLIKYFKDLYDNRNDEYANGRDVRNFFEKAYSNQANRISKLDTIDNDDLQTFVLDDLKFSEE